MYWRLARLAGYHQITHDSTQKRGVSAGLAADDSTMGLIANAPSAESTRLPDDLVEYCALGGTTEAHSYSDSFIAIRSPADLTVEPIEIVPCCADFFRPHSDSVTVNSVPRTAIQLAAISAGEYDTNRRLVWLPEIGRYAIWNSLDHSVQLFGKHMRWQAIVETTSKLLPGRAEGELHLDPDYATPIAAIEAVHKKTMIDSLLRFRRPRFADLAYSCVALVALIGSGFMMLTSELPAISPETFDQIQIGMKEHEVMRLVRASPGWYRGNEARSNFQKRRFDSITTVTDWTEGPFSNLKKGNALQSKRSYFWGSADGDLTVDFDEDGKVTYVSLVHRTGRRFSHPERWPWWKRLFNRETPGTRPAYIMF